ncbi:MAG TPA: NTF2-like N-terminal transpeptidase domain-containing protein, partial [Anaerolineales bacterium]|nr:NTF2-like N-terminal transpeptidase domain-containing protein [Anaerolineales bacterium]
MKFLRWFNILVILTLLSACGPTGIAIPGVPTDTSLPPPPVTIIPAPDAGAAVSAYLDAFKADDYNTMYSLLSKASQDSITLEDFAKRNKEALDEMSSGSFDYQVLSSLVNTYSSEVSYHIIYHTALIGDLERDIVVHLALENNQWKIKWEDALILPELAGGNVLRMDYNTPARGNIYDRDGNAIAAQSDAYAFYIVPGDVTEDSLKTLLPEIFRLCGISMDALAEQIANTPAQYPILLCEASDKESERIRSISPSGLQWQEYNSRYYFQQGVGSNIVGYTRSIDPAEVDKYRRLGYKVDDRLGGAGIEKWAENYLAGKHGGTLYVINPTTGQPVTKVGESEAKPA